uniref:Ubiquitin-like protein ATG12 n=1 Tax=Xenopsylla cheopis TaxID=163159 RepID=A0A6M2DIG8_XENCH
MTDVEPLSADTAESLPETVSGPESVIPAVERTISRDSTGSLSTKSKIDILLKATANAPIMKQKKWAVEADKQLGSIISFIKKYLKLEPEEQLFLYVNQTFAPSPDQIIRNLYECFGSDGKLTLHYCKTQAWG